MVGNKCTLGYISEIHAKLSENHVVVGHIYYKRSNKLLTFAHNMYPDLYSMSRVIKNAIVIAQGTKTDQNVGKCGVFLQFVAPIR